VTRTPALLGCDLKPTASAAGRQAALAAIVPVDVEVGVAAVTEVVAEAISVGVVAMAAETAAGKAAMESTTMEAAAMEATAHVSTATAATVTATAATRHGRRGRHPHGQQRGCDRGDDSLLRHHVTLHFTLQPVDCVSQTCGCKPAGASGHPGVQIAVGQFGGCKQRVASATC
jgi:hypothetical protein